MACLKFLVDLNNKSILSFTLTHSLTHSSLPYINYSLSDSRYRNTMKHKHKLQLLSQDLRKSLKVLLVFKMAAVSIQCTLSVF